LGKYGVAPENIKTDLSTIPNVNTHCILLDLSTHLYLRVDRLEVGFLKLHELGSHVAQQFLLESWLALRDSGLSVGITEHTLTFETHAQILSASYDTVLSRYITPPSTLGVGARAGVVFYIPENMNTGTRQWSIVLDRSTGQDQYLAVRVNIHYRTPFDTSLAI
jgi:hypothetical protein